MTSDVTETRTSIDGDLTIDGDLFFCPVGERGTIIVFGSIVARNITVKAGWSIEAGGSIESGGPIKSGGDIKSGGHIESGGSIKSGGGIKSGGHIESGGYIDSFYFSIKCKSLKTLILPYHRGFWAKMSPLKQYADIIQNPDNCWDRIRSELLPHAVEVCAWEGWHPILAAQLQMFFKLKDRVEGECL